MKKKRLSEIKHGQLVNNLTMTLSRPFDFTDVIKGLDPKSAQKVLADLVKHGYIMKSGYAYIWLKMDEDDGETNKIS